MGSSHSVQPQLPSTQNSSLLQSEQECSIERSDADNDETTTKKKRTNNNDSVRSGIALIEYKCRKKKRAWGICVKEHYEQKFLPGMSLEPAEADCDDLFERYRRCYMRGLLKQRQEERGIMDPPKEGTLLHEFMEEEGMLDTNLDATAGKRETM